MNDLDVTLRLKLKNDASREAKELKRDFKDLDGEAKKLGKSGGGNQLEKNLKGIGTAARGSKTALKDVEAEAKRLGKTATGNKLERDLAGVSSAARRGKTALRELESEARRLNRATTDKAEAELRQFGKAVRDSTKDLDKLRQKLGQFDRVKADPLKEMNGPARELDGSMGLLAGSADKAFGALLAFVSVDRIISGLEQMSSKFRDLNRDVASVAVTAETRTPEAMKAISDSNEKLAIRYGQSQTEVNSARKTYAAAGIGLDSQEAILDPTLKAAKAEDATGDTMADAMIAGKQNLKLKDEEVPAAFDMMAKGAKLGSFEVKNMAKNFPELGAYMSATGRTGLKGWAELVTMSQIARFSAGSPDEAANNLNNWLAKLSSKDTVKNFADKDVDLEKIKKKALKEDKSYPMAVLDEVMKLTGGNEFKVNELFGDRQAYMALKPLMDNRKLYEDWLKQILEGSAGTVDADYAFLRNLPKERADRRGAAFEAAGASVGGVWDSITSPIKDLFARFASTEYRDQRHIEDVSPDLRDLIDQRLGLEDRLYKMQNGEVSGSKGDVGNLKQQIQMLQELEDGLRDNLSRYGYTLPPDTRPLGKSTGEIPKPADRPARIGEVSAGQEVPLPSPRPPLEQTLAPAAEKAMGGYLDAMENAGNKAVDIAREKAKAIMDMLNFTATPTIAPRVIAPGGAPAPSSPSTSTSGKTENHSSLQNSTTNKFTTHVTAPNTKAAAARLKREQARMIQQAQARSLYDTGRRLA